ncbi:metal-dependent hydrolase family protein [Sphingosinicella rhizophila]|uniref:Amidohydrolase family protein n=1 Tax=Sphingosinicella rhizophila TaxID=3050082 RepID=A0ABU3QC88_9SPHN|nr:amidohydrolase family protein [Sphingosinicella sp. GR2756]MDT9601011.1 amidohydrolase family protein [Sphingosinicella sp. GR2756]
MTALILENARIFDGSNEECAEGMSVLINGESIEEISDKPITSQSARRMDLAGRTLMPGLIDLHIHAYASSVNLQRVATSGHTYNAAHAARMLGHALDCGFTTVRDIGGGDWSLATSIEDGLIRGPRFFYAGRIVSMTGGHGDFRPMHVSRHDEGICQCGESNVFSVLADGVDECLKATREELRQGAHCIKIMGSGGVASPADPIWMNQYREDEIRAIVGECIERRTYVSSHCHGAEAIRRSVDYGVRVIEHGTLMDAETAAHVAKKGAYVVPTMAVIFALMEEGERLGLPAVSMEKLRSVFSSALSGMEHMRDAGVKLGFGTDLLGETYIRQTQEFTIRREVFEPVEILRQATSGSAEILMREGELGCIADGAAADLIVVDGDPLKDIGLLAASGEKLDLIIRRGEIVKDRLSN